MTNRGRSDVYSPARDDLLTDIKSANDEYDWPPSRNEVAAVSEWSSTVFQRRFKDWDDTLRGMGITPRIEHVEDQLLALTDGPMMGTATAANVADALGWPHGKIRWSIKRIRAGESDRVAIENIRSEKQTARFEVTEKDD